MLMAVFLLFGCKIDDDTSLLQNDDGGADPSGNSSPTILGNPQAAILANEMYDFQPNAFDPDGDPLTFQVANKPNWATFETSTGRLYGQPTINNLGIFDDIVISVSDGSASKSLPKFAIAVTQTALGNVTLSWAAPTQNADGSPLTDLAGYKIFYGTVSTNYDHEIVIDNPGMTTYVVDNLVPDTYYFAAKSFNASGIESDFSAESVRTVN